MSLFLAIRVTYRSRRTDISRRNTGRDPAGFGLPFPPLIIFSYRVQSNTLAKGCGPGVYRCSNSIGNPACSDQPVILRRLCLQPGGEINVKRDAVIENLETKNDPKTLPHDS